MTPDRGPARAVPLLYLSTAHAALGCAFLCAACWPQAVAGFFYHSWLIGLVHLVTLGWITASILGAVYIVGPLALRMEMPPRRPDYVAYALFLVGLVGMVGHFWIQQFSGMAWSAATLTCGLLYMTVRIVSCVASAHIQRAVKLHIILACANLWIAAVMGLLIATDKVLHFLPGYVLSNVFAHAHVAALGWATMMVIGVAYRMLPMTFPSKVPSGRSIYASAVLLEVGTVGLFAALLLGSGLAVVFAIAIVVGIASFLAHVVWMRLQPAPRPAGAPRIDFGVLHTAGAGVSLTIAAGIGVALVTRASSPQMLHAAAAYGVFGLVGFLSQMVVAMETRLLPIVTWFWAYARSDYRVAPPSPHDMRDRALQAMVFVGWTAGVPALAAGMFLEAAPLVAVGAWALVAAVAIGAVDNACVVMQGFQVREPLCSSKSVSVRITPSTNRSGC